MLSTLLCGAALHAGALMNGCSMCSNTPDYSRPDATPHPRQGGVRPTAQFGFKVQKSERLLIREAWERADAYRPGKANWFTQQQKDLVELHETLMPELDACPPSGPPGIPGAGNVTSLLGALLKSLTTGDLALTLCSKEPPVLTELREWLITALTMEEAVVGLPEEQGRVLATIARAMDARKLLDLGTFTGYSSIAMALATADDAKVICCEPATEYARHARDWWHKAGCASKMEMHVRATPRTRNAHERRPGAPCHAYACPPHRTRASARTQFPCMRGRVRCTVSKWHYFRQCLSAT